MCTYYIIEPESKVRDKIKSVFDEFPDFRFIGAAENLDESLGVIYKECPSLIFIDLDLSSNLFYNINEVNSYLDDPPEFIGLSLSTDLAYKAIKTNFFDYLTKPIDELELRKAALRFKKKCNTKKVKKNLCLKSYKDYHYIDTDEIVLLKADNNTTDFHMSDGSTIIAYKTLKTFQSILPENFVRIHKSYIVNIDYVNRINYGKNLCTVKELKESIPFTKTYLSNVEKLTQSLTKTSVLSLN